MSPQASTSIVKLPNGIPDADGYAHSRTEKECYDAFQSLEYKSTRCIRQRPTPFVTFGFGLGTSWGHA
ncbi:hypothetical protein [Yokenella regensburgei]|uniref:hypothetical protein n=1 Tax=Yokenella regensburgei TaxID=158877 RepID=UPI001FD75617|nr:hypothetical protein [Yokenella regensburgei]